MKIPQFKTQTWLLLSTLPPIGVLCVLLGLMLHRLTEQTILDNFQAKLSTIGLTSSVFIDGEEQLWLTTPYRFSAMAYSKSQDRLMAIDPHTSSWGAINPSSGVFVSVPNIPDIEFDRISIDPSDDSLYAFRTGVGNLFRADSHLRGVEEVAKIPQDVIDLTLVPSERKLLFLRDSQILPYDLDSGNWLSALPLPEVAPVRSILYIPETGLIWAITANPVEIIAFVPGQRSLEHQIRLKQEDSADFTTDWLIDWTDFYDIPSASAPAPTLAWDSKRKLLFLGSLSLTSVELNFEEEHLDPNWRNLDFARIFGKEDDPLYTKYAAPMAQIMEELNLTFLYTMIVRNGRHLYYGVDSASEEDHSPLLSEEEALDETDATGIAVAAGLNQTYTTKVKRWEQWGLLKSSFSPILKEDQSAAGFVGVDINISIINEKTHRALVMVILIALSSATIATMIALLISKQLVSPISRIKNIALRAAAGEKNLSLSILNPWEIAQLSDAFNNISITMEERLEEVRHSSVNSFNIECTRELTQRIGRVQSQSQFLPFSHFATSHVDNHSSIEPSSFFCDQNRVLIFWCDSNTPDRSIDEATLGAVLKGLSKTLIRRYGDELDSDFDAIIAPYLKGSVTSAMLIGLEDGSYQICGDVEDRVSLAIPFVGMQPLHGPSKKRGTLGEGEMLLSHSPSIPFSALQTCLKDCSWDGKISPTSYVRKLTRSSVWTDQMPPEIASTEKGLLIAFTTEVLRQNREKLTELASKDVVFSKALDPFKPGEASYLLSLANLVENPSKPISFKLEEGKMAQYGPVILCFKGSIETLTPEGESYRFRMGEWIICEPEILQVRTIKPRSYTSLLIWDHETIEQMRAEQPQVFKVLFAKQSLNKRAKG
jgi:hypothetical protein